MTDWEIENTFTQPCPVTGCKEQITFKKIDDDDLITFYYTGKCPVHPIELMLVISPEEKVKCSECSWFKSCHKRETEELFTDPNNCHGFKPKRNCKVIEEIKEESN